jgi:hypothetical protein
MAIADKIIALMDTMTRASLDDLSPVRRRQFADLCRHWAQLAEEPKGASKREPKSFPTIFQAAKEEVRGLASESDRFPAAASVAGHASAHSRKPQRTS